MISRIAIKALYFVCSVLMAANLCAQDAANEDIRAPIDAPVAPSEVSFWGEDEEELWLQGPEWGGADSALGRTLFEVEVPVPTFGAQSEAVNGSGPPPLRHVDDPLHYQSDPEGYEFEPEWSVPDDSMRQRFRLMPPLVYHGLKKWKLRFHWPEGRYTGRGHPLVGTSWRNRPFYFDMFTGGLFGTSSITPYANQGNGMIAGGRFGWDGSHYLGTEFRFATADTSLVNQFQRGDLRFYDASLLYYPWGDSMFRPFAGLGLGVTQYILVDQQGTVIKDATVSMPVSIGMKYYLRQWLTMRVDLTDNLSFGSKFIHSAHNFSITGGMEIRMGGRRKSYYPFYPSRFLW